MKTKPLLITVSALALIAILAWRTQQSGSGSADPAHPRVDRSLLDPDLLVTARKIQLVSKDDDQTVTLARTDTGEWFLPEHFGIPADFEKLSEFTRNLMETKVQRFVTENPERLERLEMGSKRIALFDESEEPIWTMETGSRPDKGGAYLRFNDDAGAYLTHTSLFIDTSPLSWMNRRPLEFDEADVARVTLTSKGESLALERSGEDADFEGTDLEEDQQVKSGEVSRLLRTLLSARFTEAVRSDDQEALAAREHARRITLELFNGDSYILDVGRRPAAPSTEIAQAGTENTAPSSGPSEDEPASASIVFDQDGKIVTNEGAPTSAERTSSSIDTESEQQENPGPVFIFYDSPSTEFVWEQITNEGALKFPDRIFDALPTSFDELIETVESEVTEEEENDITTAADSDSAKG